MVTHGLAADERAGEVDARKRLKAWCSMVHYGVEWGAMPKTNNAVRQSISLPRRIAKHVQAIARAQKMSANRVLVELIEAGLESKESEKERFFALANRLSETTEPRERERLKKELARMTFGE
jgi:hypothetical protein